MRPCWASARRKVGAAVGLHDDRSARIAGFIHQAEAGLAVGGDAEGGLRGRVGVEEDDSRDAVGEADFGARLAVVAVDAERGGAVGADAEAGAQRAGAVEDGDLCDALAGDIEFAASLAVTVNEHELLRGDHAGRVGGVNGARGEDMAGHAATNEGGGESQGHKPEALFDCHDRGLLSRCRGWDNFRGED